MKLSTDNRKTLLVTSIAFLGLLFIDTIVYETLVVTSRPISLEVLLRSHLLAPHAIVEAPLITILSLLSVATFHSIFAWGFTVERGIFDCVHRSRSHASKKFLTWEETWANIRSPFPTVTFLRINKTSFILAFAVTLIFDIVSRWQGIVVAQSVFVGLIVGCVHTETANFVRRRWEPEILPSARESLETQSTRERKHRIVEFLIGLPLGKS